MGSRMTKERTDYISKQMGFSEEARQVFKIWNRSEDSESAFLAGYVVGKHERDFHACKKK